MAALHRTSTADMVQDLVAQPKKQASTKREFNKLVESQGEETKQEEREEEKDATLEVEENDIRRATWNRLILGDSGQNLGPNPSQAGIP